MTESCLWANIPFSNVDKIFRFSLTLIGPGSSLLTKKYKLAEPEIWITWKDFYHNVKAFQKQAKKYLIRVIIQLQKIG